MAVTVRPVSAESAYASFHGPPQGSGRVPAGIPNRFPSPFRRACRKGGEKAPQAPWNRIGAAARKGGGRANRNASPRAPGKSRATTRAAHHTRRRARRGPPDAPERAPRASGK
ncbi:hypothetical protein GCM10010269_03280 [Streptomyces humidus]|uniref:Uncharacterized protein n=1 Tax=Streptomyces humidus TaxID=52259 RepID=A0A918L0Q0_9ACTN|nr:hypothetical protein GCM10010269_03280 [Streptomyces humidus]